MSNNCARNYVKSITYCSKQANSWSITHAENQLLDNRRTLIFQ